MVKSIERQANSTDKQLLIDATNQETYLSAMQGMISSKCTSTVKLGFSVFQTNLEAGKWILGSLSMPDLVKDYALRSIN